MTASIEFRKYGERRTVGAASRVFIVGEKVATEFTPDSFRIIAPDDRGFDYTLVVDAREARRIARTLAALARMTPADFDFKGDTP